MAALPTLSRWAASQDWVAYRRTLGAGLRAVLVLIVPATIGLWVLAEPVVRLIAQHGEFTAIDTYWTALVLRFYLPGLIFASIDWPLNVSYYARNDSRTPAIVGVISVAAYLVVALSLLNTLSFLGLALADAVKHAVHALIMAWLLYRWGGRLHQGVLSTVWRTVLAGAVMGLAVFGVATPLLARLGTEGLASRLVVVTVPAVVGGIVYYGLLRVLRVPDAALFDRLVRRALRR